jgi:hypothetical protein
MENLSSAGPCADGELRRLPCVAREWFCISMVSNGDDIETVEIWDVQQSGTVRYMRVLTGPAYAT